MSETPITIEAFDARTIPLAEWNHRAHLTVSWLMLRRYGMDFDAALAHLRRGIQAYNALHRIEVTPTSGYHESLTVAWLRILHTTMSVYGPEESAEAFLATHTQLQSRVLLRLFYSRPKIMSMEARLGWVEPDLAPLPLPSSVLGS